MSSTIYPGRVVAIDPGGPICIVPGLAGAAHWGPLTTLVGGLTVGESVAVANMGASRDQLLILGRMQGRLPDLDEIPGLPAMLSAIDIRIDALQIDQETDHGVLDEHGGRLDEHGERLDDVDAGQLAQNGRLTAVEGVNTTQNTRLTAAEGAATTLTGRVTATEGVANGAVTVNATQNTRLTSGAAFEKYHWEGTGGLANGDRLQIIGWPTNGSGNSSRIASPHSTGGAVTLGREGRWALALGAFSDFGTPGYTEVEMRWPGGAFGLTSIMDGRWHGGGVPSAGRAWQWARWVGWVTQAQANIAMTPWIFQVNTSEINMSGLTFYMNLQYMGSGA